MSHPRLRDFFLILLLVSSGMAQTFPATWPTNYDESKSGTYTLPDLLLMSDGTPVKTAYVWMNKRRPEVMRLFEENEFGRCPERPEQMTWDVWDTDRAAIEGKAIRKQITVSFTGKKDVGPQMDLAMYLPAGSGAHKPSPMILCISFGGNHMQYPDPKLKIKQSWNARTKQRVTPAEDTRGRSRSYPVEQVLSRGYGIGFINYQDIEPDFDGGIQYGVRAMYFKPGQTDVGPDEWGSIAAWGWGMSRALDVLEQDPDVDAKRVAIFGMSRLGKTVLWAGARDTRFAAVIANCSGEGGAALSRRDYGETVDDLTRRFPWQFCRNYKKYAHALAQLPVDSHMEVALVAPRPLLLNTGIDDRWSDPRGEFLAAAAAGPVYRLLGKTDLGTSEFPPLDHRVGGDLSFQCHQGKHEILPADWNAALDVLDQHFKK